MPLIVLFVFLLRGGDGRCGGTEGGGCVWAAPYRAASRPSRRAVPEQGVVELGRGSHPSGVGELPLSLVLLLLDLGIVFSSLIGWAMEGGGSGDGCE